MAGDLQKYKIEQLPDSVYYIPEFISESEETNLLKQIYAAPKPKWTQLSNRRLQNWGGLPHPKGMVPESLPDWLNVHCQSISGLGIFEVGKTANHVLINEYLPGQGIMPHTDGPLYYPAVSNITLASHVVLDFYHPVPDETEVDLSLKHDNVCSGDDDMISSKTSLEDRYFASVLLQRRGLFLLADRAYSGFLHGIREVESDTITSKVVNLDKCSGVALGDTIARSTRVSLTIRVVPKVLKTKLFLGKR